jgi:ribonuclease HI
MIKVTICFDGACGYRLGGNLVGLGVVATSNKFTYEHAESYQYLGNNMIAEWMALIRSLELALLIEAKHGRCYFTIKGDNQAVVYHMKGIYKDVKQDYKQYANRAEDLTNKLRYIQFKWIPREENEEADLLSKIGRLKWFE